MHPWLSVLIPTYNGENFLPHALDSIAIQEDTDIECIVVDDGSSDNTLKILHEYQNRIPNLMVRQERHGNWVINTNYALKLARGEFICLLHQDDVWFQNRLNTMKPLIDEFPSIGLFLHSSTFINPRGNVLGPWKCPLPKYPSIIEPNTMIQRLLVQNFIAIPAPIFAKDLAIEVGGLDETLWYTADWDFWLKLSAKGKTMYFPKSLTGFRIHPNSQTITRSSYLREFREQLEVVAERHTKKWDAPIALKNSINQVSHFSIEANTTLAATFHGKNNSLLDLFLELIQLGPLGIYRFLRDSRIWERSFARIRARIINN